jgi:hypothetical protein
MKAIFMASASLPLAFALLDERAHAFGFVLGGGEDLEQPPFVQDALLEA